MLITAAAGLGFVGWHLQHSDRGQAQFRTVRVTRGRLAKTVTATGQLIPVVNVLVGSQISGTIQKLFVDFNSSVKAGQVLAQIDASTYLANLDQAAGDLANAKAALELVQINLTRNRELRAHNLAPQSELDKSVADTHQAEAIVKMKEALLTKAKVDLDRCTISAPIDGLVISRNVDVGQTVAASLSAPTLFVIANDLRKMRIEAKVAEADIGAVAVDQDVDFTVDAFSQQTFQGKVTQIRNAPNSDQNVVTYDTIIEVSNPDLKLKPGMTAKVAIVVARHDEILLIPNAALRFRLPAGSEEKKERPSAVALGKDKRTFERTVYVMNATSQSSVAGMKRGPQPVRVRTGISDGTDTEILEGLNETSEVVVSMRLIKEDSSQLLNPFTASRKRN